MPADVSELLFETAHLTVRRLGPDDAAAMLAVYGDAEAMRWVDDGRPIEPAECKRWVEVTLGNYERRGYGMSVLVERSTAEVVGFCGLVHPGGQEEPELKYALLRSAWGRGLATEAARGMLRYGRETLGIRRVIATIAPANAASRRVLEKAGMRYREQRVAADGERTDVWEWLAEGAD